MTKSFKQLKNKMPAAALRQARKKTDAMLEEVALQTLRQEQGISQENLAELLTTKQANVSRLERRTDMRISTLRSYVEALGGKLQLTAEFPSKKIAINQFEEKTNS